VKNQYIVQVNRPAGDTESKRVYTVSATGFRDFLSEARFCLPVGAHSCTIAKKGAPIWEGFLVNVGITKPATFIGEQKAKTVEVDYTFTVKDFEYYTELGTRLEILTAAPNGITFVALLPRKVSFFVPLSEINYIDKDPCVDEIEIVCGF
jgi:hypothetical protein